MPDALVKVPRISKTLGIALVALAPACGGDSPTAPSQTAEADSGTLEVGLIRGGSAELLMSVVVAIGDQRSQRVLDGPAAMISGLDPGPATVEASDPTPGCSVIDENPKSIEIVRARVVQLTFVLRCDFVPTSRVVFSKPGGGSASDIWTVRPGGGDLQQLTANGTSYTPDWSPDATRIAYWGPTGPVWVMNYDGSEQRILSSIEGEQPAWSPDGRQIVFTTLGVPRALYLMNADGSGLRDLGVAGKTPAWSPDGGQIVFSSDDDELTVMNAAGGDVRTLARGAFPSWAPDGQTIAFDSTGPVPTDPVQIWRINVDGSGLTQLTDISPGCGGPDHAPDGSAILFHCPRRSQESVWIIGPNGENPRLFTTVPAPRAKHARWSPAP